jgi:predicted RNA-binding protein with PUA-like domain
LVSQQNVLLSKLIPVGSSGKNNEKAYMNYWLVKSEPFKFSFDELLKKKKTMWDGVRNYQARNNLAAMKKDDLLLFYHSNEGKEVVGLAKVAKESYPDPTADDAKWVVVDVVPVKKFKKTVTLEQIKAEPRLQTMLIIRHSRLSVIPVKPEEFDVIMELAGE